MPRFSELSKVDSFRPASLHHRIKETKLRRVFWLGQGLEQSHMYTTHHNALTVDSNFLVQWSAATCLLLRLPFQADLGNVPRRL